MGCSFWSLLSLERELKLCMSVLCVKQAENTDTGHPLRRAVDSTVNQTISVRTTSPPTKANKKSHWNLYSVKEEKKKRCHQGLQNDMNLQRSCLSPAHADALP